MADSIGNLALKLSVDAGEWRGGIDKASGDITSLSGRVAAAGDKIRSSVDSAGSSLKTFLGNVTAAGGTGAAAFSELQGTVTGLATSLAMAGGPAGALAVTVVAVGAGFLAMAQHASKAVQEVNKFAKSVGTSAGEAQVLLRLFENAGQSREEAQAGLFRTFNMIGTAARNPSGPEAEHIRRAGLDAVELARLDPAQAFIQLGTAVQNIPDRFERASVSMGIFHRSAVQLDEMLQSFTERLADARIGTALSGASEETLAQAAANAARERRNQALGLSGSRNAFSQGWDRFSTWAYGQQQDLQDRILASQGLDPGRVAALLRVAAGGTRRPTSALSAATDPNREALNIELERHFAEANRTVEMISAIQDRAATSALHAGLAATRTDYMGRADYSLETEKRIAEALADGNVQRAEAIRHEDRLERAAQRQLELTQQRNAALRAARGDYEQFEDSVRHIAEMFPQSTLTATPAPLPDLRSESEQLRAAAGLGSAREIGDGLGEAIVNAMANVDPRQAMLAGDAFMKLEKSFGKTPDVGSLNAVDARSIEAIRIVANARQQAGRDNEPVAERVARVMAAQLERTEQANADRRRFGEETIRQLGAIARPAVAPGI